MVKMVWRTLRKTIYALWTLASAGSVWTELRKQNCDVLDCRVVQYLNPRLISIFYGSYRAKEKLWLGVYLSLQVSTKCWQPQWRCYHIRQYWLCAEWVAMRAHWSINYQNTRYYVKELCQRGTLMESLLTVQLPSSKSWCLMSGKECTSSSSKWQLDGSPFTSSSSLWSVLSSL